MICLGIESTAHTFGMGILDDKKILSDEKAVYIPKKGSGIIPRDAAQHHAENAKVVLEKSLENAGIKIADVDRIAFSMGPGLPQCLRVGAVFSRILSMKYGIPLVAVNHCVAHIEIGKMSVDSKDPVVLYLSGGNSQIIAFTGGRYRIFGETVDNPIGNALDLVARGMGFAMPGGPQIEKLAKNGSYFPLPYVVKGMDLSFSGLITAALNKYRNGKSAEDVAYSFQEICFSMLAEVTERAVAHTDKEEVILVGGVAANKRLQEMLTIMCKERGAVFSAVPIQYAGDNGSMIAWNGIINKETVDVKDSKIIQKWRTDEVEINWM